MCTKENLFYYVAMQSAFDVLCVSVTFLSFSKQTVMSGAKDLDWKVVSLGRLNAS